MPPEKNVSLTIEMPWSMKAEIKSIAKEEERSISGLIRILIQRHISQKEG